MQAAQSCWEPGLLRFSTSRTFTFWARSMKCCIKSCSQETEHYRSSPQCEYGFKTSLPSASPGHLGKLMLEHYKPAALSLFCASSRVSCRQVAEISQTLTSLKLGFVFLVLAVQLAKSSLSSAFPHKG